MKSISLYQLLGLLGFNDKGLAVGGKDGNDDLIVSVLNFVPESHDAIKSLAFWWKVDILAHGVVESEKLSVVVLDVDEGIILAVNEWNLDIMGGWEVSFVTAASEEIGTGDTSLGVTVLSGLGFGDIDNTAWATLDEDIAALLKLVDWDGGHLL